MPVQVSSSMNSNKLYHANNVLHSASCVEFKDTILLACYQCKHEGWGQRINIYKLNFADFRVIDVETIQIDGGGNPVIFYFSKNLFLMYSVFSSHTENKEMSVPDLWKHTEVYIKRLDKYSKNGFFLYDKTDIFHRPNTGCRCAPTKYKGELLLPLYDEEYKQALIYSMDENFSVKRLYTLGHQQVPMIQPSLYVADNTLRFYARSFVGRGKDKNCVVGRLVNNGWQIGIDQKIPNHNESIVIVDNEFIVFNAKRGREDLTMATVNLSRSIVLNENGKASYPNWCKNNDKTYTVVYTDYSGKSLIYGTRICIIKINRELEILRREYIESI